MNDSKLLNMNALIHENSPYLLQHAHNPVQWYPWGEAALEKAKNENKLLLISIGYSACHWCHVMEKESFEDSETATLMNDNFINIKVDREERPDIDQVYMLAVQLMTGQGGWPLNCFCTPDGQPIYGGTYFPKNAFQNVLRQLNKMWTEEPSKVFQYSKELTDGIKQNSKILKVEGRQEFQSEIFVELVEKWKRTFDFEDGGPNRSPKFPMPDNYTFLLNYALQTDDHELKKFVQLTLDKMADGGIYDQLGGGFARYSTDMKWKIPHFEKMLYDNAQLISLYSKAWLISGNNIYKNVVEESIQFVVDELMHPSGLFYCALDADSEGHEGKFYIWQKEDLQNLLKDDFGVFASYYNVNATGYWEDGFYILMKTKSAEETAAEFHLPINVFHDKILKSKKILKEERNKRVKPGLDDKHLTSWNALMISALCHAGKAFQSHEYIFQAEKSFDVLWENAAKADGTLFHSFKNNKAIINGFLEDYAFLIQATIDLYTSTFKTEYLLKAKDLMNVAIDNFYDSPSGMFRFKSKEDATLISEQFEVHDNVIPSSNAAMANNLFTLSKYFDQQEWMKMSSQMLSNVQEDILKFPSAHSHWAQLMMKFAFPFFEIVVTGRNAVKEAEQFNHFHFQNAMIVTAENEMEQLPLTMNKNFEREVSYYVCSNNTCQAPENNFNAILPFLNKTVFSH